MVLAYLPNMAYGHTVSYGAVAAAVGHPRAVRAVGTACATNPLPLVAILYLETSPADGRDADWNSWYDEVHVPEILEHVRGIKAASRYTRAPGGQLGPDDQGYYTVDEIESDDSNGTFQELLSAGKAEKFTMSDASSGRAKMTLWVEHTPRKTAPQS